MEADLRHMDSGSKELIMQKLREEGSRFAQNPTDLESIRFMGSLAAHRRHLNAINAPYDLARERRERRAQHREYLVQQRRENEQARLDAEGLVDSQVRRLREAEDARRSLRLGDSFTRATHRSSGPVLEMGSFGRGVRRSRGRRTRKRRGRKTGKRRARGRRTRGRRTRGRRTRGRRTRGRRK